jgi:hypothetical protein
MLALTKPEADFSQGCALPVIARRFLATHPPTLSEGPEPLQESPGPMWTCVRP